MSKPLTAIQVRDNQEPEGPRRDRGCWVCIHLDHPYPDDGDNGLMCNKREYRNTSEELRHYDQLNDPGYLSAPKKCQERKKVSR